MTPSFGILRCCLLRVCRLPVTGSTSRKPNRTNQQYLYFRYFYRMDLYNDNQRFISILSDYGFKVTFGNESDTRFLRKALQALIQSPVAIREVTFIQNEIKGITRDSRSGVYDLFCTDEQDNHFIVEMQLSEYAEFIHRMKFYAFYRLNTLVRKGDYEFDGLSKIYCIGILAVSIFSHIADYQNIAVLKNQHNELIDDQMTARSAPVYHRRVRQVQQKLRGD